MESRSASARLDLVLSLLHHPCVLTQRVSHRSNPCSRSPKCVALFEALDDLQVAVTGEVAAPTTAASVGTPVESAASAAAAPGPIAGGGQAGQFKPAATQSNNGCWPYN